MMGAEPAGKRLLAGTGRAAPLLSPGTNTFDARWNSLLSPRPRSKGFPGKTHCQQLPTVRAMPSLSAFGCVVLLLPGGAGCPGVQANLRPVGGLLGRERRAHAAAPGGCLGLLHYLIPNLQHPRAERTRTEGPSGIPPWLPSPSPPAQLGGSGDKGRAELCSLHVEVCRSLSAAPRITTPP